MAKIPTISELSDVFPHMLGRDMNVRAAHIAFEMTPMAFNRVRVVMLAAYAEIRASSSPKRIVGLIVHVVGEKIQCMGIDHRRTIGSLFP